MTHRSALHHWLRDLEQNRQALLRPLMIIGVLLGSAALAPRASMRNVAVLVGTGVALIFLRWPPLGLLALVVGSPLVPFAIGTGTATELNIAALLVGLLLALWLVEMFRQGQIRLARSGPIRPLLAFMGACCLAFAAGTQPWLIFAQTAPFRTQLGGLGLFILSAGAFLLAAHQIPSLAWLERLVWAYLALGGLYIASRLGLFPSVPFQEGAYGSLFWVWVIALAFSQAIFNPRLAFLVRLVLLGVVVGALYVGLFHTLAWTSGWLPGLAALVGVVWAGAPRLALPLSVFGGAGMTWKLPTIIADIMVGDNQYSTLTRLEAWRILAEIIKANPIVGLGPANYYWYTPLFPILGYAVSFNSHNNYVDLVAQTGLVGLLTFLWFVWRVARLGWQLRDRVPQGFARAYVYGVLGGLAGTLVAGALGDWVIPFAYNVGYSGFRTSVVGWLFLGGLLVVERCVIPTSES